VPAFVREADALDEADHARLKERLLSSSFVSKSPLMGTFEGSKGFALVFTERGVSEVLARFPEVGPYLAAARKDAPRKKLAGALARLRHKELPRPNAFYLNLLVLEPGDAVGPHVDATLRDPSGDPDAVPTLVSVLYLEVPSAGGELVLADLTRGVYEVLPPARGAMVWFRGDLNHEVRAFEGDAGPLRASLVLEQYALDDEALARMPRFKVQSKAGFAGYFNR
jgi:hypothetical protein